MNKFGFAAVVASGLAAAILGLAAPAHGAAAVNVLTAVPSAIDIPTHTGDHAGAIEIQRPSVLDADTGNHTPTPRGAPQCGCPSFVGINRSRTAVHRYGAPTCRTLKITAWASCRRDS